MNECTGYQLAAVRLVIVYSGGKALRTAVRQLRRMILYVYLQDFLLPCFILDFLY